MHLNSEVRTIFSRHIPLKKIFITLIFLIPLLGKAQSLDKEQVVAIKKIEIKGNKITKRHIITRELDFKVGDSFSIKTLDSLFKNAEKLIYNYNLFDDIKISISKIERGLATVLIELNERWYIYPGFIFRLADKNFNDWWVNRNRDLKRALIGGELVIFNFRGRAEKLAFGAKFGFETQLNLNYSVPFIDKKQRNGIQLWASHDRTKNLAYKSDKNVRLFKSAQQTIKTTTKVSIEHKYRKKFYASHYTNFEFQSIQLADTAKYFAFNYLNNNQLTQKNLSLSYRYVWGRLDASSYPLVGTKFDVYLLKMGLGVFNDIDYWTFETSYSRYLQLDKKKKWFYGTNLYVLYNTPENQGVHNFNGLGIRQRAMRGHDIYVVESGRMITQKNNFKRKIFHYEQDISKFMPLKQFRKFPITLYGKLFFDHGYAKSYPNYTTTSNLTDRYLYAYGAGLDLILLYDYIIRFEYSLNTLNERHFFLNFRVTAF